MAKRTEIGCLASIERRRLMKINRGEKTLSYNPNITHIGNKTWGMLDYLTKYCGWSLVKDYKLN